MDLKNFKQFGRNKEVVLMIDESKLTLDIIDQIRNYLNVQESKLKKSKQ